MRKIKFRAWDKKNNVMYPASELGEDQLSVDPNGGGFYNPDPVDTKKTRWCTHLIPMQFTGLLDKNKVEIYEGDIVKCGYGTGEVVSLCGCFMVQWIDDKGADMELLGFNNKYMRAREDDEIFEVISNIHQTPLP